MDLTLFEFVDSTTERVALPREFERFTSSYPIDWEGVETPVSPEGTIGIHELDVRGLSEVGLREPRYERIERAVVSKV